MLRAAVARSANLLFMAEGVGVQITATTPNEFAEFSVFRATS